MYLDIDIKDLLGKLENENTFLKDILTNLEYNIFIVDVSTYKIIFSNKDLDYSFVADREIPKCYEISHHNNKPCGDLHHRCPITEIKNTNDAFSVIHKHFSIEGKEEYFEVMGIPLFDDDGKLKYIIESSRNVSEMITSHEGLNYIANHDNLTDLPNRVLFFDRLKKEILRAKRNDESIYILFIDIDHFKQINDTHGHSVGDIVIKDVALKLKNCFRESDTVSRLGGDEFVIMISNINSDVNINNILDKILNIFSLPVIIDSFGEPLSISISIGVSIYSGDGEDAKMLLKNADAAMYKAKEKYGNSFAFYHSSMTEETLKILEIERGLKKALINNEFDIHYQPKVNLKSDKIIGVEALIRWNHPKLGLLYPDYFIEIAESNNIIIDITKWVINKVSSDLNKLHSKDLDPGIISINIDEKSIKDQDFFNTFNEIIDANNCKSKHFGIEVIERYLVTNSEQSILNLKKFRDKGVRIYIDDFGIGHSSLSILTKLPIDVLKIDKSFIFNLFKNKADSSIVKTIIALAKELGFEVIAEGVEKQKQKKFLLKLGCDDIQGYVFAKPMPFEDLVTMLKKRL